MKRYCINYITGEKKGEDLIYAQNKEQAKNKARDKHKNDLYYQIVSVWQHYYLNELINE